MEAIKTCTLVLRKFNPRSPDLLRVMQWNTLIDAGVIEFE